MMNQKAKLILIGFITTFVVAVILSLSLETDNDKVYKNNIEEITLTCVKYLSPPDNFDSEESKKILNSITLDSAMIYFSEAITKRTKSYNQKYILLDSIQEYFKKFVLSNQSLPDSINSSDKYYSYLYNNKFSNFRRIVNRYCVGKKQKETKQVIGYNQKNFTALVMPIIIKYGLQFQNNKLNKYVVIAAYSISIAFLILFSLIYFKVIVTNTTADSNVIKSLVEKIKNLETGLKKVEGTINPEMLKNFESFKAVYQDFLAFDKLVNLKATIESIQKNLSTKSNIDDFNSLKNQLVSISKFVEKSDRARPDKISQLLELVLLLETNPSPEIKEKFVKIVNNINNELTESKLSQLRNELFIEMESIDLEIHNLIDENIKKSEKSILESFKKHFEEFEKSVLLKMDSKLLETEKNIYDKLYKQILMFFNVQQTKIAAFFNGKKKNFVPEYTDTNFDAENSDTIIEEFVIDRPIDFYLPIPDMKGFFWKDQSLIKPDSESYYAVRYKNNSRYTAFFRIMENKIGTALKDADICLKPVCEDISKSFSGNSLNLKAEGELKLNGEKWELVKKCKIQVY